MRLKLTVISLLLVAWAVPSLGQEKATSLAEARSAVEANLRTPEGKAFDEKLGTEFVQHHLDPIRRCKISADGELESFWILLKLDKDGAVKEVLLYPSTKLGSCARPSLLADKLLAPPRPEYWVSIYLKLGNNGR